MNREKLRHRVRRAYGPSKSSQRVTVYHGTSSKIAKVHQKKGFHRWAYFALRGDAITYARRRHLDRGKPALIKSRVPKSYLYKYDIESKRKLRVYQAKRPIPSRFVKKVIMGKELRALANRYPRGRKR